MSKLTDNAVWTWVRETGMALEKCDGGWCCYHKETGSYGPTSDDPFTACTAAKQLGLGQLPAMTSEEIVTWVTAFVTAVQAGKWPLARVKDGHAYWQFQLKNNASLHFSAHKDFGQAVNDISNAGSGTQRWPKILKGAK